MTRISVLTILFSFSLTAVADVIEVGGELPPIKGKTLSEIEVSVPEHVKDEVVLLVVTFTKASGKPAREWSQRFWKEYSDQKTAGLMQLIFLQSVPRLFRGMVRSGIKKGMPEPLHDRTMLIYENEKEWKELLGFTGKDDLPFLILLNRDGKIEWLHHKIFAQDDFDQLILKTNVLIEQK